MSLDLEAIFAEVAKRSKNPNVATLGQLERLALVRSQHFSTTRIRGIDLFAGAGGFTIGALQQNCSIIGIERQQRGVRSGRQAGHDVLRMDVQQAAERMAGLRMDLLIGGPPCQPFSSAGKGRGRFDPRDGFGLALQAVDAWKPTRVVLENVADFLADKYRPYRKQIYGELHDRYPHSGAWLLNAQDYGVPQSRQRVFIWAAEVELQPPPPTHGPGTGRPFVTARQALPHLLAEGFAGLMSFQGGATSRTTHRTSPTVTTARNLYAVKGQGLTYRGAGSVPSRHRRILYPKEIQALQSFPATFGFYGTMKDQAIQIGNAVPPPLASAVVGAAAAGLRPRQVSPGELLDSFGRIDEDIWVYEPRPWTDEALIGVTTMKAGALGELVPVYDSAKLKDAAFDAAVDTAAKQHKVRGKDVFERAEKLGGIPGRSRGGQTALEEAENQALDWVFADKSSRYQPSAGVVVPVKTLKEIGLPIATMLLPSVERSETGAWGPVTQRQAAMYQGALRYAKKQGWYDPIKQMPEPGEILMQISAEYGEILEY